MESLFVIVGLFIGASLTFWRKGSGRGEKIAGVVAVLAILWWLRP